MSVTLAQLLERQTPIAWFEAVAIVQALYAALIDHAGDRASVPELRDIAITPEGHLEVLADGPASQPAVHRAGRVLTALVDQQHMPVPLRLLALTAVSPEPTYGSLGELSAALEYFERPDRAKVVAAVYARYEQMPAPESGAEIPALPVLEEEPAKPKRERNVWRRRRVVAAATCAGLLAVAIPSVWWLWGRPEGQWLRVGTQKVSQAVTAATDTVVSVAGSGVRAVKETFAGTTATAPAPEPVATASAETMGRPPARRHGPLPSKPVGGTPDNATRAALFTSLPVAASDPWMAAASAPLFGDPFLVVAVPIDEQGPVYSEADVSVVPPELVRPRLPRFPPPGVPLESLPRLEVVVSATGDVESVKLLAAGAGVYPAMMVSAVKNWRFEPAVRDGKPVRYRYSLWLTR